MILSCGQCLSIVVMIFAACFGAIGIFFSILYRRLFWQHKKSEEKEQTNK